MLFGVAFPTLIITIVGASGGKNSSSGGQNKADHHRAVAVWADPCVTNEW